MGGYYIMRIENFFNASCQKVSGAFTKLSLRDRVIYSLGAATVTLFGLYFLKMVLQSLIGRVSAGILLTEQKTYHEDLKALAERPESLLTIYKPPQAKWRAFFECACCPAFDRTKSLVRKRTEEILIGKIQEKYPLNQKKSLTICSIASGGCFQELILHAKLTLLGYQVNWVLVDPAYFSEGASSDTACKDAAEAFKAFTKEHTPKTQVTIAYDSDQIFSHLRQGDLKPDIFLSIHSDLENTHAVVEQDSDIAGDVPNRLPSGFDGPILTGLLNKINALIKQIQTPYLYLLIFGRVQGTLMDKSSSGLETTRLPQLGLLALKK